MSGMLDYGMMAGVGKEWLKQSEEKRANNFQAIRDKRLHGMRKENITYENQLKTTEAIRHEGYLTDQAEITAEARKTETDADRGALKGRNDDTIAGAQKRQDSETYTLGRGQQRYDNDGKLIASGPEYTHPGNATAQKWHDEKIMRRGVGGKSAGAGTRGELQKEWFDRAYVDQYIDPENPFMGTEKVRNPDTLGWIEYHNATVTDEYKLEVNDPKYMQGDPDQLFRHMQENVKNLDEADAIARLKEKYKFWKGPKGSTDLNDPRVPSPDPAPPNPSQADSMPPGTPQTAGDAAARTAPTNTAGVTPQGGMLEQASTPGGVSVRSGTTFNVNSGEIEKLENMLKNPNWNTKDRQRLEKRLAELKAQKATME